MSRVHLTIDKPDGIADYVIKVSEVCGLARFIEAERATCGNLGVADDE